jgi:hypothetical protein
VVAVRDDVEAVGEGGPSHGRVGPFAVGVIAREDERVTAGESLGGVGGHRIAVLERRPAAWSSPLEEGCVELNGAIVHTNREGAGVEIDGVDDAAFAVADVESRAVVLDDDAIADGEAACRGDQFVRPKPSGDPHDGAGAPVELCNIGAKMGDHQAAVRVAGGVPI